MKDLQTISAVSYWPLLVMQPSWAHVISFWLPFLLFFVAFIFLFAISSIAAASEALDVLTSSFSSINLWSLLLTSSPTFVFLFTLFTVIFWVSVPISFSEIIPVVFTTLLFSWPYFLWSPSPFSWLLRFSIKPQIMHWVDVFVCSAIFDLTLYFLFSGHSSLYFPFPFLSLTSEFFGPCWLDQGHMRGDRYWVLCWRNFSSILQLNLLSLFQ